MLSVVMLSVVMMNVVMLSVVAPYKLVYVILVLSDEGIYFLVCISGHRTINTTLQ